MQGTQGLREGFTQNKNDCCEGKRHDTELFNRTQCCGNDDQEIRDQHHKRHGMEQAEIQVGAKITCRKPGKTMEAGRQECQRQATPALKTLNSVVRMDSKRSEPEGKRKKIYADDVICE